LSCKAYDLESAINSFAAAVGPHTMILPLLNGMRHLDTLAARFGAERVIGGLCMISVARAPDGSILHLNDLHNLTFGELDGGPSARVTAIAEQFTDVGFEAQSSVTIRQEMWEKWVFISSAAAITCLMRASIGDIVAAGAADLAIDMFDECAAIAAANGFAPREEFSKKTRALLTAPGSPLTASMLRDLEAGGQVESDAILGDMLHRANDSSGKASLLRIACAHVKAYEARRARN
jgi:2-dehydropantoate 2-reductase